MNPWSFFYRLYFFTAPYFYQMTASPKTPGGVKSSLFLSEQNHLFPIATSELNHLFFTFIGEKVILFTC